MGSRAFIITVDDLGRWPEVNDAVMAGYDAGIVTSAGLRVSAPDSDSAMVSCGMRPNLGVGLHLVLCDGQSTLPHRHIPNLVDSSGNFVSRPLEAAWLYRRRGGMRAELKAEIRAQIERFLAGGLFLSHISGHYNLHLQPAILSIIKELAVDYPISAIRKPVTQLWRSSQPLTMSPLQRFAERSLVRPVLRWGRARPGAFLGPNRVALLADTRPVTEDVVARRLRSAGRVVTEFVCHAGSLEPQYDGIGELAVVTSRPVREAIEQSGLEPISYRDLAEGTAFAT
ncbi:MAG: ChbG/HpnK family deacetylase [Myxococcales bacterium]|nr:MAG: ChbG/HpnK family deacetylase [Myxococcales bacterium]